jgi:hypothetical protein
MTADEENLSSGVLLPEAVRFQRIDHTRHELRELAKPWNNRLVLENLSLTKAYIECRIAIFLVMDCGLASGSGFATLLDSNAVGSNYGRNSIHGSRRDRRRIIFLFLADCDHEMMLMANRRNQQSMLVHSVQTIEPKKERIGSFVRFYLISDEQSQIWSDSLYKSVFSGMYERVPRIVHRENHSGFFRVVAADPDDITCKKVQGCTEIVNPPTINATSLEYPRGLVTTIW